MRFIPLGFAAAALMAVSSPAFAQSTVEPFLGGVLGTHGNYCGAGGRATGLAPVDALDAACMRHDACARESALPACPCNERLSKEAMAVAIDTGAPIEERHAAALASEVAQQLPCNR